VDLRSRCRDTMGQDRITGDCAGALNCALTCIEQIIRIGLKEGNDGFHY